jgi:hypothetical protein
LPQGALMVSDEELLRGMLRCKELGALPQVGRPAAEKGAALVGGRGSGT